MNVIVQCHAGMCRSGAVVEAGIALGFDSTETIRCPNTHVLGELVNAIVSLTSQERRSFQPLSQ